MSGFVLSAGIPAYVLGILVLIIVMVVHGGSVLQIAKRYEVKSYLYLSEKKYKQVIFTFYVAVLCLLLLHIFEIFIWGLCLFVLQLVPRLTEGILFSGSTYTAMGFMNNILPYGWEMLAIIIALSGMFAFAWTASVMISMTKNFRKAYARMHMESLNLAREIIDRFE